MASPDLHLEALLPPSALARLVADWLAEDCPNFDYGGYVVGDAPAEARLLGKSEVSKAEVEAEATGRRAMSFTTDLQGIVAGVPFFTEVFRQLDCQVEWHVAEGDAIRPVTHCATVRGPVRKILLGERVALNTLARCSGIASRSRSLLDLLRAHGYPNTLAGTRKTTPGFRLVEKYGMLVGGIDAHRHDLSTMVMLKDNHIWACGGDISSAVRKAKSVAGFSVKVEVECGSEAEAATAVAAGADVVMLDNFEAAQVAGVAARLKAERGWAPGAAGAQGGNPPFLVEVSGGLTEANIKAYASEHIDVISTSSVHQGVKHVDFSLKVVPQAQQQKISGPDGESSDGGPSTV